MDTNLHIPNVIKNIPFFPILYHRPTKLQLQSFRQIPQGPRSGDKKTTLKDEAQTSYENTKRLGGD